MARLLQFFLMLSLVSCSREEPPRLEFQMDLNHSTSYEHLKGLAWIVGNWSNTDSDSTFTTNNQWDKYRNFITQTFSLSVLGQEDLNGRQIICWDPKEQRIRSWIFDSEGGFGQGSWYPHKDCWYVTVSYTMPDGTVASSTQIYQALNSSSYEFFSTNREIGNEILPNIGPFVLTQVLGN